MKNIHRFFMPLLISAIGCFAAAINVIENNSQRLSFWWDIGTFDTASFRYEDNVVTRIVFDEENCAVEGDGNVVLPGYSFHIGVPQQGNINVAFEPVESKVVHLSHPMVTEMESQKDKEKAAFSDTWISKPYYTVLRGHRAAYLVICPVRYNKTNGSIQVLKKGKCTITFPPANHNVSPSKSTDYARMLQRLLLNYDVARGWVIPEKPFRKRVAADLLPIQSPGNKVYTFKVGDGHEGFNESTTRENRIIKIGGSKLKELFGNDPLQVGKVTLYGSPKQEMDMEMPEINEIPDGITEIPLLRIDHNGNGLVDTDDYFLAYVSGTSDWGVRGQDFRYLLNRYNDYRCYWLTVKSIGNGRSIRQFSQPVTATRDTFDYFENWIHMKRSLFIEDEAGGLDWMWAELRLNDNHFEYPVQLQNVAPGTLPKIRVVGSYTGNSSVKIDFGEQLCDNCASFEWYQVANWKNNPLRIEFTAENNRKHYKLYHIEIRHAQALVAPETGEDMMVFSSMDTGMFHYRLSEIRDEPTYIFRIADNEKDIGLVAKVDGNGGGTYLWADSGRIGARYFICGESALSPLPELYQYPMQQREAQSGYQIPHDLRATNNRADYLIVTHKRFLDAAKRLAAHKANIGFSHPTIVCIDDVYWHFSGGAIDPAAMRNFISYAYHHWASGENLQYVVLMGSGHYDYKGISTTEINYIPTAQMWGDCFEDFFTYLNPEEGTSEQTVFLGRLPVLTTREADAVVDKIIEHEDPKKADYGRWRNRALFVADDDMEGPYRDAVNNSTPHYESSDRIAHIVGQFRPSMDIQKKYLYQSKGNSIYDKPDINSAIIEEFNKGVSFVNYFGHSSYIHWAHEHVLRLEDLSAMRNRGKYPIVTSFSCSVGHFDLPDRVCLGSAIMKKEKGGALACLGSTRLAFASSNERFATVLYKALFDTAHTPLTLGAAYMLAKTKQNSTYQRVFAIFGDPSVRLTYPQRDIAIKITTDDGQTGDTLQALQPVTVTGSIVHNNGTPDSDFGKDNEAFIYIGFFDATDTITRYDGLVLEDVAYAVEGKAIFSGVTRLENGTFEQRILIPRNVSYDAGGASIKAYAWDGATVADGFKGGIIFHGIDSTSSLISDTTGPAITVRPIYGSKDITQLRGGFSDVIVSLLPVTFAVEVFDEGGIDIRGHGPDEGLHIEVDNHAYRRNINHLFRFEEGDYRYGTAIHEFEEGMLKPGEHRVTVLAEDLSKNRSEMTFTLKVVDPHQLSLEHVFNNPNPMVMGQYTAFHFFPSSTVAQWENGQLRVTIKIYSLSGKLLRVIENAKNGEIWNGRDQIGNVLSPNVYLYQVFAESPQIQKKVKSKIKKLVIHPLR